MRRFLLVLALCACGGTKNQNNNNNNNNNMTQDMTAGHTGKVTLSLKKAR